MIRLLILGALLLTVPMAQAAPPRSLTGLWTTTVDNEALWLDLEGKALDDVALIEMVDGKLTVRPVHGVPVRLPVSGQYLPGTGVVILDIGEHGSKRKYGIGDVSGGASGSRMALKLFRLRPGSGIEFDRELRFRATGGLAPQPGPGPSPRLHR